MIENETWALGGSAKANIVRWAGSTMVEVIGLVTAQVYEALHTRLSLEHDARQIFVMLDDIMMAATSLSFVEAATRGTAGAGLPAPVTLLVRAPRLRWAKLHCALMAEHGISCSTSELPDRVRHRSPRRSAVSL